MQEPLETQKTTFSSHELVRTGEKAPLHFNVKNNQSMAHSSLCNVSQELSMKNETYSAYNSLGRLGTFDRRNHVKNLVDDLIIFDGNRRRDFIRGSVTISDVIRELKISLKSKHFANMGLFIQHVIKVA